MQEMLSDCGPQEACKDILYTNLDMYNLVYTLLIIAGLIILGLVISIIVIRKKNKNKKQDK